MNSIPASSPHHFPTSASDRPMPGQGSPRVDATQRVPAAGERALVLGGGGSTGNAWLIGVVAGLFDAELDVTTADLTIGTSAGSTAAAQMAGATPAELLAAILASAPQQRIGLAGSDRGPVPIKPVVNHLDGIRKIIASAKDAADMRRRMGAAALDMDAAADGSWQTHWRAAVASRLPSQRWPQRTMLRPVNQSYSTVTAESTWQTPSPPAAPVAFPIGSETTDTSTAATDQTPKMPTWQADIGGCSFCHPSAAKL